MNYISYIDQLGIDLNDISTIDRNGIIRLEKQLKAKAMLGDITNLNDVTIFIESLKNDNLRYAYLFIENHKWLKHIISGNYLLVKDNQIQLDNSQIDNLEDLKLFLEPYFKSHFKSFIAEHLSRGNYSIILKVLAQNDLFTEIVNQLLINIFKAKLNFAIAYIRDEKKLRIKQQPVAFLTQRNFIRCLNYYPDVFNEEIDELNSEIVNKYNTYRRNTSNLQFKYAAKAMMALSNIDTSNIFLKDNLEANAKIAAPHAYGSTKHSREKSGSGIGVWGIALIIFFIIRIGFWVSKSNSSSSNYTI